MEGNNTGEGRSAGNGTSGETSRAASNAATSTNHNRPTDRDAIQNLVERLEQLEFVEVQQVNANNPNPNRNEAANGSTSSRDVTQINGRQLPETTRLALPLLPDLSAPTRRRRIRRWYNIRKTKRKFIYLKKD